MSLSPQNYIDSFNGIQVGNAALLLYRDGKMKAMKPCGCDGWEVEFGKLPDGTECLTSEGGMFPRDGVETSVRLAAFAREAYAELDRRDRAEA
jgi:hypothetical protein